MASRLVACATARDGAQRFHSIETLAWALRRLDRTAPRASDMSTILVVEDDEVLGGVLEMGLSRRWTPGHSRWLSRDSSR
jgi:hypothetical protein